ncbi:MAG: cytochrome c biogenesis protein CcsA [Bacteroidales bacterium]|jgi:ABC-type transport system involved in cytochrome c biogenesis permease subunit|nr:cytochrome c biogenesis protein CcsA [Bacteroidales bacterium]
MDKKMGLRAFVLLALLILVMIWATWDEHAHGSEHAGSFFYNSIWFTLLWILTATVSCYFIVVRSLHKRLSVFLLHAAFLIILAGALVTRLTGKTGQVHLREGHEVSSFFDEWTHSRTVFPFSLSLKSFEIEYYPGTASPANYVSIVAVTDAGEQFEREISMNRILRYRGYRFYQSSFDEDRRGSILSVNHDTWGILLSYAGYFLMFFSMLFVLFDRRERFRFLLRKLSQKNLLVVLLSGFPILASAAPPLLTPDSLTVSREQAARLGSLWVDYQGRISPMQTLANDFTGKLTGKTRYRYASGEQVFFGWLFFPERWERVPMFGINSGELKRMAGIKGDDASLVDFIDENGRHRLEPYRRQMYGSNKPEGWLKEAVKLDDKFHLIEMLQYGSLLKIFPMRDKDGKLQWYAPDTDIPAQADSMENVFVRHFFPLYYEALMKGDEASAGMYVDKLLKFQQKKAGDTLPSAVRLKAEQIYNRVQIFSLLFKICLVTGSLCLLFFIFRTIRNTSCPRVERLFHVMLWIVFAATTAGLGLRACIGGRIPMSNGYETMLLLAWLSLLTGILTRRYSFLIMAFSFLLAGFTLLVAHIGSMNPQITPLVPVLQSPLLSIHVLTIMVAYGLCGFMALNSLTSLIVWFFGGRKVDRAAYVERMKETGELLMYPATFLMGTGIFIGAIWANMSWGRYWGWDPKEVWALITFLLMGFTFHNKTLTWFRKPLFYHVFVWIIFLSVLMTYFGVNYILGGKHSYAG